MTEETYPSGRVVKNTLDANGDLAMVQSGKCLDTARGTNATCTNRAGLWSYADSLAYNSAGAVTKMQLGNGRWETSQYNNRLQITQIGLGTTDSDQNQLKLELSYGTPTQNNGSLREQKITVPTVGQNPGFTAIQTYIYDDLNRIQSATETIGGNQTWKQTFIIDRYGNRRFDAANTTTLGSCTQAVCNPTLSTSTNRVSQTGYIFDANGNLTEDSEGRDFLYDAENHQIKVEDAQDNTLGDYFYDGEGRRVKKVAGAETTVFVYNASGQLVAEYSTQIAQDPQVSYLTTDHLGSPRVITDENGAVTSRKDFMVYGEAVVSSQRVGGTGGNGYDLPNVRQDYTGYQKDDESGLEFAQARYYNPQHGRFTSVDPLTASASIRDPQTFNRYSYVLNSPYKFTDPLGLLPQGRRDYDTGSCEAAHSSCADDWGRPEQPEVPESHSNEADGAPATANTSPAEGEPAKQEAEEPEPPPAPEDGQVEKQNGNKVDMATDASLASIVSEGGIVRGASAVGRGGREDNGNGHFEFASGQLHTIHVYGDETGTRIVGLYVPAGFTDVRYVGGAEGIVTARNPKTKEVLGFAHVDVKSQKEIDKNLKTVRKDGSKFLGNIGGPGGNSTTYKHAHISIYPSMAARQKALQNKSELGTFTSKAARHVGDFRMFAKKYTR